MYWRESIAELMSCVQLNELWMMILVETVL
ncbi:hypothetical protein EC840_104234 [Rahnella sp. JUb53]|nr:hypothetical protein EC840_104234 [Rahnella sp. JUb53]